MIRKDARSIVLGNVVVRTGKAIALRHILIQMKEMLPV